MQPETPSPVNTHATPNEKKSVCQEAHSIVHGPRRQAYGTPAENHERTAHLWSTYLGVPITARQVCILNVLQKVSRDVHAPKRDNLVDIAGYAENADLVGESTASMLASVFGKPSGLALFDKAPSSVYAEGDPVYAEPAPTPDDERRALLKLAREFRENYMPQAAILYTGCDEGQELLIYTRGEYRTQLLDYVTAFGNFTAATARRTSGRAAPMPASRACTSPDCECVDCRH